MAGVFPSVLKTAKVVPVFKNDSKLATIVQSPSYQTLRKKLGKLICKRLYIFLNNENVIYNLQFWFSRQYSTFLALTNITDNIRKALDDGNIGCEIFLDLQKAFDAVDYQILLAKLNHYGICKVSNNSFKSYLSIWNQYISINGYESGLAAINCSIL